MSVPAWIDSPGALAPIVSRVDPELRLGVDAEGDGLYRYRSRLCMMQICGGELEALIDTLALDDLTPLQPLLGEDGPLKVLHDVSFDAKMLDQRGLSLGRVFDTAVAARFLGDAPDAVQGFIPAKNGESQPIVLSGSGTTYGTHRRFGPLHPPGIYSDRAGETTE